MWQVDSWEASDILKVILNIAQKTFYQISQMLFQLSVFC